MFNVAQTIWEMGKFLRFFAKPNKCDLSAVANQLILKSQARMNKLMVKPICYIKLTEVIWDFHDEQKISKCLTHHACPYFKMCADSWAKRVW